MPASTSQHPCRAPAIRGAGSHHLMHNPPQCQAAHQRQLLLPSSDRVARIPPCTAGSLTNQSSALQGNLPAAAASAFSMRRCCLRRRCSRRSASPFSSAASSPLLRRRVSPRLLQETRTRSCQGLGILHPPCQFQQNCCTWIKEVLKAASVPLWPCRILLSLFQRRMASSHQESGHSAHPTPANAAVPVRSLLHRETGDSKLR